MPFIRKETINKQEMILSGGQGMLYNARDCIESANIFIFWVIALVWSAIFGSR